MVFCKKKFKALKVEESKELVKKIIISSLKNCPLSAQSKLSGLWADFGFIKKYGYQPISNPPTHELGISTSDHSQPKNHTLSVFRLIAFCFNFTRFIRRYSKNISKPLRQIFASRKDS